MSLIVWQAIAVLLVAYVPGALIMRLPVGNRPKRALLPAEERMFWSVVLSLVVGSIAVLGLAAAGWYRFDRLLWFDGGFAVLVILLARGRLSFGPGVSRPTWAALLPAALVAGGLWVDFMVPPAEYVMGGKDPGAYMNEGVQIAQRGTLVIADSVARGVPMPFRALFFNRVDDPTYFASRFMGFYLLNPDTGAVVGQFPHLFPAWIAVAYGVDGLTGARAVIGLWAVLGLVAVYFAGARLIGRAAAAAGAGLLAVHVMQVWYSRYPNAEIVVQALVFAAILAYARADRDGDPLFAPIAALLLVLAMFAHMSGAFAVAGVGAAALLGFVEDGRPRLAFTVPLLLGTALALVYLATFIPPYFALPAGFINNLGPSRQAAFAAVVIVVAVMALWARSAAKGSGLRWAPAVLTAVVWLLAIYAYFFRVAGDSLASYDADSLRTFTSFYLTPYALAAALLGFALVARSLSSTAPLLLTLVTFSLFFFFKIRVVPVHFWAARRFLAVILPGALLLVGAAAFGPIRWSEAGQAWTDRSIPFRARTAIGLLLVLLLGWHYFAAAQPILKHVEYAGLIPRVERLAAMIGDDDLVLVEARAASDAHVLALPLAYIYARKVLVLASASPDKQSFREFLIWAHSRYRRIIFMGGGGTELLSRAMTVKPVQGDRFQIPEYESALDAYPRGVRFKEFDLSVYEFLPGVPTAVDFDLDVGATDDLYVRHFYAKERDGQGVTFRWTKDFSYVSILGTRPGDRHLTVWMSNGGRPTSAGAAQVRIALNGNPVGTVTVGAGLQPYRFELPEDLAAAVSRSEEAAELRLDTPTWNPSRTLGGPDDRELGVMVDRVELN
jgi:hypothetical protein